MKIKNAYFCITLIIFAGLGSAMAQNSGDIYRAEFYGGYSHNRIDTGLTSEDIGDDFGNTFGKRLGANGVNFSITGNVSKLVGIKFDLATQGKTENLTFDGDQFTLKARVTNYLGGIQIKNNRKDGPLVKPFAHFLAGVARQSYTVNGPSFILEGTSPTVELAKISQSNFALGIGGGLDVRVHKRIDIRVFQFDWNPTYLKDVDFEDFTIDGKFQSNYRFGFGIVIH
ncbi:MAG: outer membrane beta-barrel protein [Pyrinomonadaceae bacterium]